MAQNKKGFTIIELLVGMGIVAALLGIGTVGAIRLKDYLEFQNGYSDIVTYVRTVENDARNSISIVKDQSGTPITSEIYAIYFFNNNISLLSCNTQAGNLTCSTIEAETRSKVFSGVTFTTSNCGSGVVGFKKSVADIFLITGNINGVSPNFLLSNGTIVNSGNCQILVTHAGLNSTRRINFDIQRNVVEFED